MLGGTALAAAPFAGPAFTSNVGTQVVRLTATAGQARYLGDTWTIVGTAATTTGTLTDVTAVTLTVWQPDGTTAGPFTANHGTTGVYSYPFAPTQAGMHTATLIAVGAVAPVASVDFYVYPTAPQATGLVSLEEVRAELRISLADLPKYRDRLTSWITASRLLIEEQVGDLVTVTRDEWYDGGSATIMLLEAPVASITAVTETFGANVIRALTLQTLDGTTPVNAYGYTADLETGQLTRRVTGVAAPFSIGRRNIHVQYVTGTPGVWRENYRLANLECLRTWWQASQQGSNPQSLNGGVDSNGEYQNAQGGIYELPPRVLRMLGRRSKAPGIA